MLDYCSAVRFSIWRKLNFPLGYSFVGICLSISILCCTLGNDFHGLLLDPACRHMSVSCWVVIAARCLISLLWISGCPKVAEMTSSYPGHGPPWLHGVSHRRRINTEAKATFRPCWLGDKISTLLLRNSFNLCRDLEYTHIQRIYNIYNICITDPSRLYQLVC